MKINPLNFIDFYKVGHKFQYPEKTHLVYANLTPRSNKRSNLPGAEKIIFFGLQYFIKDFLVNKWNEHFFQRPKHEVIEEHRQRLATSLALEEVDLTHIEALHDLGYLPIRIDALPEGSSVSMGVPVLIIMNTHPDFFWLTNYLETVLSSYLWKASTSATTAKWFKETFDDYARETSENVGFTAYQGHDFSFRGQSCYLDAAVSGAAHLTSFVGTDTVHAIDFLEEFYQADSKNELVGCSVPATEHSVMCSGIAIEKAKLIEAGENPEDAELKVFERLIKNVYPSGIVSIVSDSFDYWKVLTEYLPRLKDDIKNREGKVVIRPDSGDPFYILCGYQRINSFDIDYDIDYNVLDKQTCYAIEIDGTWYEFFWNFELGWIVRSELSEAEVKGSLEILWETFGGFVNEKGYKELHSSIGLIYGDSITPQRAQRILERMAEKGFASTNVVFGLGSYLYQYVTRDTYSFAVKTTYVEVDGKGYSIKKDPKTGDGTKTSAEGLLAVIDGKLYNNMKILDPSEGTDMNTVFFNGRVTQDLSLKEIRERVSQQSILRKDS